MWYQTLQRMVPQGISSKRTALCLSGVFKNPLEIPQILLSLLPVLFALLYQEFT
jgi:hypothetical protein